MRSTAAEIKRSRSAVKEILDAGARGPANLAATVTAFTYITKQHQFDLALSELRAATVLGVDIETSGYYTYYNEVCLIQISAGGRHYVVDPLVGLNLSRLAEVFAEPSIVKVFHGAASDIAELRRGTDWEFRNVFDTLLCCRLLAHEGCSLGNLTERYLGVPLEKKEQKSNWKRRPLTAAQLEYAYHDTVHLEELRHRMLEELPEELLPELQADCDWICDTSHSREREVDPNRWLRIPGALALDPLHRGFLVALLEIREDRAAKENVAAFRLLTNDGVVRIARALPKTEDELRRAGLVNPKMLRKDGPRIVRAAQECKPITDADLPKPPELDARVAERLRWLKKWRAAMAEYRGLDTSLIVSNRVLEVIALETPPDVEALGGLTLLNSWKLAHYGADLVAVCREGFQGSLNKKAPRLAVRAGK